MNMKMQILSCSIALAFCHGAVAQQKNAEALSSTGTSSTNAPSKTTAALSYDEAEYSRSMERLRKAAQSLREAVQAMATRPAGERRNEAMRQANDALRETQEAMVQLPPELRKAAGTDASSGSGVSGKRASSSGSAAAAMPSAATINAKVPVLVMVPVQLKMEDHAKGCWAKVYDDQKHQGDSMTLLGPLDLAQMRASLGFSWENMIESVETGPKAQLTIYDNENFRDRAKIIEPGKKVGDLDEKLGFFEDIRSMKVSCT
jgi:hypothetical protein